MTNYLFVLPLIFFPLASPAESSMPWFEGGKIYFYNASNGACTDASGSHGLHKVDSLKIEEWKTRFVIEKSENIPFIKPFMPSGAEIRVMPNIDLECTDMTGYEGQFALIGDYYVHSANMKGARFEVGGPFNFQVTLGLGNINNADLQGTNINGLNPVYFKLVGRIDKFTRLMHDAAINFGYCKDIKKRPDGFPDSVVNANDIRCWFFD